MADSDDETGATPAPTFRHRRPTVSAGLSQDGETEGEERSIAPVRDDAEPVETQPEHAAPAEDRGSGPPPVAGPAPPVLATREDPAPPTDAGLASSQRVVRGDRRDRVKSDHDTGRPAPRVPEAEAAADLRPDDLIGWRDPDPSTGDLRERAMREARAAQIAVLLTEKLGLRGKSLTEMAKKARRRLPHRRRRQLDVVLAGIDDAAPPTEDRRFDQAHRRLKSYLEGIDLKRLRARRRAGTAATIAFQMLIVVGLLIAVLRWRGFL